MKRSLIFFLFVILVSCTKGLDTPEGVLKGFVSERFKKDLNINTLTGFLGGKLLESIQELSEEDKRKYFNLNGISKKSFKVTSKSCRNNKCYLTYIVAYYSTVDKNTKFTSKTKKIAELEKVENKWKIISVNNVKTHHKANQAIDAL
jgi:HSP90 family molecular chaperone